MNEDPFDKSAESSEAEAAWESEGGSTRPLHLPRSFAVLDDVQGAATEPLVSTGEVPDVAVVVAVGGSVLLVLWGFAGGPLMLIAVALVAYFAFGALFKIFERSARK